MANNPIKLSTAAENWRLFNLRKADEAFRGLEKKVLERDNYTCQYCGFQARQHQEIVNLDGNYRNNKKNNLVTACCFCTQCFFLEFVGKGRYGGGSLIYFPDITQNELNAFCHVLFCAMTNATNYSNDAQNIYRSMKLRSKLVDKHLGENMSDPSILGRVLIDGPLPEREKTAENVLQNLRLLPSREKFNEQITDWVKSAMCELSTED